MTRQGSLWNPMRKRTTTFKKHMIKLRNNNNNNSNNNNNNNNGEKILLTTMLTIKILFTINSLEKKKKLFIQNTIYNSCRFKKHLI